MRTYCNRVAAFAVLSYLFLLGPGCQASYPRRDPTGERLPTVQGISLDEKAWRLPEDLEDRSAILLLGYQQDAQFDLDRWLLGLFEAGVDVPIYEVPTVVGMVPGWISGTINEGMRGGIPSEDWAAVITIYDDAPLLAAFTGNVGAPTGRILVLDSDWRVRFFHDEGYSVATMARLRETLKSLATGDNDADDDKTGGKETRQ